MGVLYAEGVIEHDTLQFTETEGRVGRLELVQLDGIVYTPAGGVLETHKSLSVEYRRGSPYVSTSRYVYMALRRIDGSAQSLFRYDNSHGDVQTLHRHYFDDAGRPAGQEPVDPERMPYMDDVIRATARLASYLASREQ